MSDVAERFQNLHEFIKVAKQNLNRNNFDYIVGATETETTLARNRQSLDCIAFKPRVLRNVQDVDTSTELYGRKIRIPVLIAPVGGLQLFWQGGAATVAAAAGEFGIPRPSPAPRASPRKPPTRSRSSSSTRAATTNISTVSTSARRMPASRRSSASRSTSPTTRGASATW
jgi:hypothetical protein